MQEYSWSLEDKYLDKREKRLTTDWLTTASIKPEFE